MRGECLNLRRRISATPSPALNGVIGESSEGRPRLLAGVSVAGSGEFGVTACIVEATGKLQRYESVRLIDLVRQVWPGTEQPGTLCRRLRFLVDSTKHDFVLRSSRDAIFVRSDIARAMIEPSRVLFLGIHSPTFTSFLEELLSNMEDGTYLQERCFNSWIVECILCANVTLHSLRLSVMKPVATHILDNIRLDKIEDSVLQLYPVKKALSTIVEQVRPLVNCLVHGGDVEKEAHPHRRHRNSWQREISPAADEEVDDGQVGRDGSESSLSTGQAPSVAGSWTTRALLTTPGIEEVLDSWTLTAEEVMADAAELGANIEDAIRFLEASMSCMRNRLLTLELGAEVAALVFSMGALISGIFGMNLTSGVEEEPYWFNSVVGLIIGLGVVISCVSLYIVYRSRSHYSKHSAQFGNNRFFRCFDDDDYILSFGVGVSNRELPHSALERALQDLTEPALPVRGGATASSPGSSYAQGRRVSSGPSFPLTEGSSNRTRDITPRFMGPRTAPTSEAQQELHPLGPDPRTLLTTTDDQ
mmetsp:Transcript_2897/g.5164  ORF Transcript_2897/g.5164 Transcript_2897/m.5164 type:complete len:531 (+) Transcript_2897:58-1650(+)